MIPREEERRRRRELNLLTAQRLDDTVQLFATQLADLWGEVGRDVLKRLAKSDPAALANLVASLVDKPEGGRP